MSLQEYVGAVTLELDTVEIEVSAFSVQVQTGRKPVNTISKAQGFKGFTEGKKIYQLSVTAVVPIDGNQPDWEVIKNAKLTVQPVVGGPRCSYRNCFTVEVGEKYQVDGEAVIDIKLMSSTKFKE